MAAVTSMAARSADLGIVENRSFLLSDFRLQSGTLLPEVKIVYETYGRLGNDRNGLLITHGYTSSYHASGGNPANGNQPGWWDGLIGPGSAIDTDKRFVVSSNMLGSSFGSTNSASINPATGKPYGPDFSAITVRDVVMVEKVLLDSFGVKHLIAVAGPSYGGYQPFQWAVTGPDFMGGIVTVVSPPRAQDVEKNPAELQARLAAQRVARLP
jgi:homoserine O-acetyltransferase/O-succinyltransferase